MLLQHSAAQAEAGPIASATAGSPMIASLAESEPLAVGAAVAASLLLRTLSSLTSPWKKALPWASVTA